MLGRYRWAAEDLDLAWTAAVIHGHQEQSVVTAYGGNPAEPLGTMAFDDVPWVSDEDMGGYFYLQTLTTNAHVLAIEKNGWAGTSHQVAVRASRQGHFFSVYWSPVATRIVEAVDGAVTAAFDPLLVGAPAGQGDIYPDWIGEVVFGTDAVQPAMLEAMELRTGIAFDRGWLDLVLPTYRIPDPRQL